MSRSILSYDAMLSKCDSIHALRKRATHSGMTKRKLQRHRCQRHAKFIADGFQIPSLFHHFLAGIVVVELGTIHSTSGEYTGVEGATDHHADAMFEAPVQYAAFPSREV